MTDTFVREVERVGRDPVYWVRKEASYALGALAKVVPKEIVIMSLVRRRSVPVPPLFFLTSSL
jgi:hypothetical protein